MQFRRAEGRGGLTAKGKTWRGIFQPLLYSRRGGWAPAQRIFATYVRLRRGSPGTGGGRAHPGHHSGGACPGCAAPRASQDMARPRVRLSYPGCTYYIWLVCGVRWAPGPGGGHFLHPPARSRQRWSDATFFSTGHWKETVRQLLIRTTSVSHPQTASPTEPLDSMYFDLSFSRGQAKSRAKSPEIQLDLVS